MSAAHETHLLLKFLSEINNAKIVGNAMNHKFEIESVS